MKFERTGFKGELRRGDESFPVAFEAWAGEDLRLHIEIGPVPHRAAVALTSAMGRPGSTAENLTLEGRADTGVALHSDTVDLSGIQYGHPSSGLRVSARGVRIKGERSGTGEGAMARLWFRGFKSYGTPPVSSALGRVEVRGAHRTPEDDDVTGFAAIYTDRELPLSDWIKQTDPMLTFLHLGLAFASGRRLQTPGVEMVSGTQWEGVYYAGSGFGRGLAPIQFMDQRAFVEALVRRYESAERFPDALWTVAGWLHIETPFDPARLLMAMTALEMLCAQVLPSGGFSLVDQDAFAPVRRKLLSVVEETALDPDLKAALEHRVKLLNGPSFVNKLRRLRDHYALSPETFSDQEIAELVKVRNTLVHSGQSGKGQGLWQKIVFVRALVSSVVIRELGYEGPWQSFLDGRG